MIEDILNDFAHVLAKEKTSVFYTRSPTQFEFEGCELKEESTFAECLFGEVPQIQKDLVILFFFSSYQMIHLCRSI